MPGQLPITEPRPADRRSQLPRRALFNPSEAAQHSSIQPTAEVNTENPSVRMPAHMPNVQPPLSPLARPILTFGQFAERLGNENTRPQSPVSSTSGYFRPSPNNPFRVLLNNNPLPEPQNSVNTRQEVRVKNEPISIAQPRNDPQRAPSANTSRPAVSTLNPVAGYSLLQTDKPREFLRTTTNVPVQETQNNRAEGSSQYQSTWHDNDSDYTDDNPPRTERLHKLGSPLINGIYASSERISEVILEIPTCLSTTTFAKGESEGSENTWERYYVVLKLAEESLGKPLPSGRQLACPEARDFFQGEYKALHELLTHVWRYKHEGGGVGYRLDMNRWKELSARLNEIKTCGK
ncbi:hypothetical protein DFP72DRAFT_1078892 [Ephemerocybe angulata]|uniref:Uncharacterized protein n=1 Tax=Ephemerocybe angulata TaxID=980116 RepID=A0A8H6HBU4_9AGAR|nr:hypothetical protein DFP72DRAFT_1078892 [Tulosesus angulatus]